MINAFEICDCCLEWVFFMKGFHVEIKKGNEVVRRYFRCAECDKRLKKERRKKK